MCLHIGKARETFARQSGNEINDYLCYYVTIQ